AHWARSPIRGPGAVIDAAVSAPVLRLSQDDGAHDLVRQRLPLVVPQREQPADVADDAVDDVGDVAHERQEHAGGLTGGLLDQLRSGDAAADGVTGRAAAVPAVVNRQGEEVQNPQVVEEVRAGAHDGVADGRDARRTDRIQDPARYGEGDEVDDPAERARGPLSESPDGAALPVGPGVGRRSAVALLAV